MAVRLVQVRVFQKSGDRQQDVGVFRSVSFELLQNNCEQILTPQTLRDSGLVGRNGGRVGVVNHQCLYRWLVQFQQCLSQLAHIHQSRLTAQGGNHLQVWPFQRVMIQLECAGRGQL